MAETKEVVEHEVDAVPGRRKKVESLCLSTHDTTINAMVDFEGTIMSGLVGDGFANLTAQARATHGVKKGRYYYEVEVLDTVKDQTWQISMGFSTADAKWVGAEKSVAFNHLSQFRVNGELEKSIPKQLNKQDVIGLLINLDVKTTNKNTVSLFVNGARASEPKALPKNLLNETLFPHVAVMGCSLGVNFKIIKAPLPFTVWMLGEAANVDVEKSKVAPVENPIVHFAVGVNPEGWAESFLAKNPDYIAVTPKFLMEWIKESNLEKKSDHFFGVQCFDQIHCLATWLRLRPRNVLFSVGELLFEKERAAKVEMFPGYTKMCTVTGVSGKSDRVYTKYAEASLPTAEDGYDTVCSAEGVEIDLDLWKRDQKLRTKADDLQAGTWFSERLGEWTKFVNEKKKSDEGKLFTDEDWMLATIRVELLNLLFAFKEDVNDEERPSFPTALMNTYYKLYQPSKHLNPQAFACDTVDQLLQEYLSDCLAVDEQGLLKATNFEKDFSADAVFEMVEKARYVRETRVGAGDEMSELNFSAQAAAAMRAPKGQSKGNSGYKKRPGDFGGQPPQPQRIRVN